MGWDRSKSKWLVFFKGIDKNEMDEISKDFVNKVLLSKIKQGALAEIERLDPAMKTYVVWMVTDRETTENIGRINSSNSLDVSFEAVSSYQPIKIFITAEENESAQVPSEKIVLSTDNFWE